nr:MAG TPA: phospho-N-acetylmuramoyl-pentapeptide-transferase [Caudoviricetes sp.]
MTTTILTTPTMGGEVYVGFHRKADGTAYVFADVADSRWQEGFWEARSGSVLMTPDEALLVAEDFDKLKQLMEARS